jgi:hypothetical protein
MVKLAGTNSLALLSSFILAMLLWGCQPALYCNVINKTNQTVHIDFTFEGSGTLLPHFDLKPGASRRVTSTLHLLVTAHDANGRVLDSISISDIPRDRRYYDRSTNTFGLAMTGAGLVPTAPGIDDRTR